MKRLFAFMATWAAFTLAANPVPPGPLSIDIVPPLNRDGNAMVFASDQSYRAFYIVISNSSDETQRVFEDWNSWGHECLSFEAVTRQGRKVILKRQPRAYSKNFPSTYVLFPHGYYVLPVTLSTNEWENVLEISRRDSQPVALKAIYENPKPDTNTFRVWFGRIESPVRTVTVER